MANNYSSENSSQVWIRELSNRMLEIHYPGEKDIIVNEQEYGLFTFLTGNETDRNSCILNLIRLRWHEGILYMSSTKDECNMIYNWIFDNLINKEADPLTGKYLNVDDVLIFNSESENKIEFERIQDKKIVLCTFCEFTSETGEYLMAGNFIKTSTVFGKSRQIINGYSEMMPRQWILIDELPNEFPLGLMKILLELISYPSEMMLKAFLFLSKLGIKYEDVCRRKKDSIIYEYSKSNNSNVFNINGIDNIFYPIEYKSLFTLESSKSKFSRSVHLNNRSTQEKLMDLLVRINYFDVMIHREVPFINNKSYYLADYYIPSKNLIIELDSNFHNEDEDVVRDLYFNDLGIKVARFKNFTASDTEVKSIKDLINSIESTVPRVYKFNKPGGIDFSHLIGTKNILHINDGYDNVVLKKILNKCLSTNEISVEYDNSVRFEFNFIKLI